jgi:hypothetical protein
VGNGLPRSLTAPPDFSRIRRHVDTQFPSLLGRDVINNWRMTYDPQANRLEIDVVKDLRKIQVSAGTSSSGNPLP